MMLKITSTIMFASKPGQMKIRGLWIAVSFQWGLKLTPSHFCFQKFWWELRKRLLEIEISSKVVQLYLMLNTFTHNQARIRH